MDTIEKSQFLYEKNYFSANSQQKRLFEYFIRLSKNQPDKLIEFLKTIEKDKRD